MSSKPAFEFWFDFASPYSFLASQRLEPAAAKAGVPLTYRPFMLGIVLRECGWDGAPVANNPAKARYMWRDIARIAQQRGHGFKAPSVFPRNPTLADRVAQVAADEGWAGQFVPKTFAAAFIDDREIGEPAVIAELIASCGQDAEAVLARAQGEDNRQRLRAGTQEALARGMFGAPNFTIGDELFWGDDRLEAALEWWRETPVR